LVNYEYECVLLKSLYCFWYLCLIQWWQNWNLLKHWTWLHWVFWWDFLELTLLLSECEKEMWLENKSTNLFPRENSRLNRSNNLKIPFNLLFISTIGLLIFNFCFVVRFSIDSRWCSLLEECLTFSIELMI